MRVLFASRHPPLKAEIEALEKIFREPVSFEVYRGSLSKAEHLIEYAEKEKIQYILAVLPLWFIYHLYTLGKQKNITVLYSVMKPVKETKSLTEAELLVSQDPGRRTYVDYGKIYKVFEFVEIRRIAGISIRLLPLKDPKDEAEERKIAEGMMSTGEGRDPRAVPYILEELGNLVDLLFAQINPRILNKAEMLIKMLREIR